MLGHRQHPKGNIHIKPVVYRKKFKPAHKSWKILQNILRQDEQNYVRHQGKPFGDLFLNEKNANLFLFQVQNLLVESSNKVCLLK